MEDGINWMKLDSMDDAIYAPKMISHFQLDFIIDIEAGGHNSQAKSNKDEHWLWGANHFKQCDLKQSYQYNLRNVKTEPIMIQDIFYELTKRKIKSVYLSVDTIYIVGKPLLPQFL